MTFCQKTLQPQGPERKIFSIYTNRRKKKLEQQLKNDHQFCNNDHDQEMQSYAKGHGNSSAARALCTLFNRDDRFARWCRPFPKHFFEPFH